MCINPVSPKRIIIKLLLTLSIHNQEKKLWELMKSSIHHQRYQYTIKRKKWENLRNDNQREDALILEQFLSNNSLRKCMEISLENLYVNIRASPVPPPLLCQPLFLNQQSGHSWHNLKTKNRKLRSTFYKGNDIFIMWLCKKSYLA